jgi:flagellar hook-basal body complex protein FliE
MSDIKINLGASLQPPSVKARDKADGGDFQRMMVDALAKVNEIQGEAEEAINGLAEGGDVTKAVIAMEKADLSFQLMTEVRNKLLNAYEDIMRMQV